MRCRAVVQLGTLIFLLLMTWIITNHSLDVRKRARDMFGMDYVEEEESTPAPKIKCSLDKDCAPGHFALRINSGAANVVGPTICFEGKKVMSPLRNNVGPGLNIVVVNGENGTVDSSEYLNSNLGKSEEILAYLKKIEAGRIVLIASYGDATPKMTDEIRDVLESMGSTLIKTLKNKDNWVFAGRAGAATKSLFEKVSVSDVKTNKYDDWPEVVELSGCFPQHSS